MTALRNAAGNFYINDKPTGAVVGQQPFGGARARARTTRPARSSTSCAGSARGRSRRPSRRRPTTAIRSWDPPDVAQPRALAERSFFPGEGQHRRQAVALREHFQPKIVGELNGQHVKLVKFQGEFVWHSHEAEDEMFLVLQGVFDMQFRDKTVRVGEGEFLVVPRGVEHCPKAEAEVSLMLFEPAGTVNTGTAGGEMTVPDPERL